ncbi:MAG: hypothetical protein ABWY12_08190 [Burkholderiales bacterium]
MTFDQFIAAVGVIASTGVAIAAWRTAVSAQRLAAGSARAESLREEKQRRIEFAEVLLGSFRRRKEQLAEGVVDDGPAFDTSLRNRVGMLETPSAPIILDWIAAAFEYVRDSAPLKSGIGESELQYLDNDFTARLSEWVWAGAFDEQPFRFPPWESLFGTEPAGGD